MPRPLPRKMPIQGGMRDLRVEWSKDGWMVWLNANGDWTIGTFLLLHHDDMGIERITWFPDGGESRFEL